MRNHIFLKLETLRVEGFRDVLIDLGGK